MPSRAQSHFFPGEHFRNTALTAPAANYRISANLNLNTDANPDFKPNPNLNLSKNALRGKNAIAPPSSCLQVSLWFKFVSASQV